MPLLEITTNTSISNEQDIAIKASRLTADILGKPESYVMVKMHNDQTLIFAGNNKPAAHVQLKSLNLPEEKTTEYSSALCNFLENELNINSSRIYIEFINPKRHLWGWDKKTF